MKKYFLTFPILLITILAIASLFSIVSGALPKEAASPIVGLEGFLYFFTGVILQKAGSHASVFVYFSGMYLFSLRAIRLLMPHIVIAKTK